MSKQTHTIQYTQTYLGHTSFRTVPAFGTETEVVLAMLDLADYVNESTLVATELATGKVIRFEDIPDDFDTIMGVYSACLGDEISVDDAETHERLRTIETPAGFDPLDQPMVDSLDGMTVEQVQEVEAMVRADADEE